MRNKILIPILFLLTIILTSCVSQGGKAFLPEYCQTYNQFINIVSDDFYKILAENDYKIEKNKFSDSIVEVKLLEINADDQLNEFNLNGIQCFPYVNDLELSGKAIKDISPLIKLERVEKLKIDNTRIFNLEPLKNMTKLKSLTINNTNTLQSLKGIENFKRLEGIDLANNGLIKIEELENLVNLETININSNEIRSIEKLGTLPKLNILNAGNNQIDFNAVTEIAGFKALQSLNVASNNICKTEALGTLENLTFLDLSDNNLTNSKNDSSCQQIEPDFTFIKNISTLKILHVRNNELNSLESIQDVDLKYLQELDFSHNQIPSIIPLIENTSLQNGVLTTLKLTDNNIENVDNINQIDSLKILHLNKNKIGEDVANTIDDIFKLSIIEEVDLSENFITILPAMNELTMPSIKKLILSDNKLTEITNFKDNDSLVELNLKLNEITVINNSFSGMESLARITWYENLADDEKKNIIGTINNSFIDIPELSFYLGDVATPGEFRFDFIAYDTAITNSFKELTQFTYVDLNDFGIISIDIESFDLQNVTSVKIDNNQLVDIKWINNIPNIIELSAKNNSITLVSEDLNPNKIKTLDLSGNQITNVEFLSKIGDIETLNLENNLITIDSSTLISNFPFLKTVNLMNNQITILNGFKNLPLLTDLNVSGNGIVEINGLVDLPLLNNLTIDLTGSINQINGLSNLGVQTLDLQGLTASNLTITMNSLQDNKFYDLDLSSKTLVDFQFLSNLTYIKNLYLNYTNITNLTPLSGLNNLEKLYLNKDYYDNKIVNITSLENLTSLQELELNNNGISNISILENLTKLKILSLVNNDINTIQLNYSLTESVFDKMSSLQELSLQGNNNLTLLVGLNNMHLLTYLYLPTTVVTFTNTLNNTNNLSFINNYNYNTFYIGSEMTFTNSFNSTQFEQIYFPSLYSKNLNNSFKYLTSLHLSNTDYSNINFITYMNNLVTLDFSGNTSIQNITNLTCSTSNLIKLQNIYLSDSITSINGSFNNCTNLSNVNLNYNINEIQGSFKSDKVIDLTFPNLYAQSLTLTDSFTYLETLDVSNTVMNDYHFIENLTSLETLIMDNLSGYFETLPIDVSKLTKLEILSISDITVGSIDYLFNNSMLKNINLSNITINSISNSFTDNANLTDVNLSNTNIVSISGSFSNNAILANLYLSNGNIDSISNTFTDNTNLTNINLNNTNIVSISGSFNNNKFSYLTINSYSTNLDVSDSFNNNTYLTQIYFDNSYNHDIFISNSFNNTPLWDMNFSYTDRVMELTGFNNTDLWILNPYNNIKTISGFENVPFESINLVSNQLTDISFMDNINKDNLYVLNLYNLSLTQTEISTIINNCPQLSYLYLNNVLTNLDSINISLINKLSYISMNHTMLVKEKVINILTQKTTSNLLEINIEGITEADFYQHFENDSNLINRESIEQEIIATEEQEFRLQMEYEYPDLTDEEIDSLVEDHLFDFAAEVGGLVEIEVTNIVNNAMNKFYIN